MLPFWSMSNVISLNQFNYFRASWTENLPVSIETKLNTRLSIQANKLDLATSYVAQLQHRKVICAIVSITVTAAAVALWLKHRMKHISSRGPYLSSRKAANSTLLLSPYKSHSSLQLWNDALKCILVSALAGSTAQQALRKLGGLAAAYAREWLTLLRHSPWLWLVVLIQERWIFANQITATKWSHRQLTCILFYCQIVMTILTKNSHRLQL